MAARPALVTADPVGIALDSFRAVLVPDTRELITWNIRDFGFDMVLSGAGAGRDPRCACTITPPTSSTALPIESIDLWAVHPGGRTVLDAVERAFELAPTALAASREVLRRYGNMSSATVMFVIETLMRIERARRSPAAPCRSAPGWSRKRCCFVPQPDQHQPVTTSSLTHGSNRPSAAAGFRCRAPQRANGNSRRPGRDRRA